MTNTESDLNRVMRIANRLGREDRESLLYVDVTRLAARLNPETSDNTIARELKASAALNRDPTLAYQ